jgi:hypothetical protein
VSARRRRLWTRADESRLARLAASGVCAEDAAHLLGRTLDAVWTKARLLRIRFRNRGHPGDPVKRARLLDWMRATPGGRLDDYARLVGTSRQVVYKMVARLARDGLLVRTGGAGRRCRYVVSVKWVANEKRMVCRIA